MGLPEDGAFDYLPISLSNACGTLKTKESAMSASTKESDEDGIRTYAMYVGTYPDDSSELEIFFEDETVADRREEPFQAEAKGDVELDGDDEAVFDALMLLDGPSEGAVREILRTFFRAGYLLGQKNPGLKIYAGEDSC